VERMTNWMSENWPWLAALLGLGGQALRNEFNTKRLQNTVFDVKTGDLRLVKNEQCRLSMEQCKVLSEQKISAIMDTQIAHFEALQDSIVELRTDVREVMRMQSQDYKRG
jgi:hypothetical protein